MATTRLDTPAVVAQHDSTVVMARRSGTDVSGAVPLRLGLLHTLSVILITVATFSVSQATCYRGMNSGDGLNYCAIARSHSEGRGFHSSVIQLGLMSVIPTDRLGQPFILQAPLWPLLLGEWFRLVGPSFEAMQVLNVLLCTIAAVECWWIGYLMTRSAAAAYFATLLYVTNTFTIGMTLLGCNVGAQASIFGAVFLLLFCRPNAYVVAGMGVLLGLGLLARENSIFCLFAIAWCWWSYHRNRMPSHSLWQFMRSRTALLSLALPLAAVVVIAFGISFIEAWRKASLIGRWDLPAFRMTFLYGTSIYGLHWHYQFEPEVFAVSPLNYFLRHPKELLSKMYYMLNVGFVRETLPQLLSPAGLFLPLAFPWFIKETRGRRVALGLFAALACQIVFAAMSYLHFTYFFTYLPALCPVIAATALAFYRRSFAAPRIGFAALLYGGLLFYCIAPIAYNVFIAASGKADLGGDLTAISASQASKMVDFVERNTPKDAVVATCTYNSVYVSWYTRRVILQYCAAPACRISDSDMWRRIDRRLPVDYILLSSISAENPSMKVLPGFELVHTLNEPDIQAWLFARREHQTRSAPNLPRQGRQGEKTALPLANSH